ncbi:MAG: hypothetical protein J6A83_07530 [Clostridia bacterium]|nr:hypothetical protein [Clostridia bacterium]
MMTKKEQKDYFKADGVFAASNSSDGFKSYYGEIFDGKKLQRLYIIKGGPGTGKSSFMKDAAKCAEGRGYSVEYYYCSSDPDSLDGIVIDGRVAIIDGTAPHTCDTIIAGARDEIINLGEFWDGARLAERYSEILALSEKKSAAYRKGYRYLTACGELSEINTSLFYPALKEKKMLSSVARIVSAFPSGEVGGQRTALVDSIGMRGRVRFDTYEKCATKIYSVIDWYSTAHLFLRAVAVCAERRNIPITVSYDPINAERPDAVFLRNSGVAFVSVPPSEAEDAVGTRVNMKRFIDKDAADRVKKEYKYNTRLYEALLSSACEAFEEAGEYHFALERIYSSCMDFAAKERYTASFCEMLLGILENKK